MDDSHFLSLPSELRGLAAFLETDRRPSAVYNGSTMENDGQPYSSPLYSNKAFRNKFCDQDTLKALREELSRREITPGMPQEIVSRKGIFSRSSVMRSWEVLTFREQEGGTLAAADNRQHRNGSHLETASTVAERPKDATLGVLDWFKDPTQAATPWARHVLQFDWASTKLGPTAQWPMALKQSIVAILMNPSPRCFLWGQDMIMIYNDACIPVFGVKHPQSLARPCSELWPEAWVDIGPIMFATLQGKPHTLQRMPLTLNRAASEPEEAFFDIALMPVMGPDGQAIGVSDEFTECTELARGARRRSCMMRLAEQIRTATTLNDLWTVYMQGLESAVDDIVYALFYDTANDQPDGAKRGAKNSKQVYVLRHAMGLAAADVDGLGSLALKDDITAPVGLAKAAADALRGKHVVRISVKDQTLPQPLAVQVEGRAGGNKVQSALVFPIYSTLAHDDLGVLVLGLNPRCPYDEEYKLWSSIVADMLAKAVLGITLPAEQERMQRLADVTNAALAEQLRLTTLQVERSEASFSRMAQNAPTGMYMFDAEGRLLYMNDAYLDLLGEEARAFSHKGQLTPWETLLHPEDYERFVAAWNSLLEHKTPITIEYRLQRPWQSLDTATGQTLTGETWLRSNAYPETGMTGEVVSVQGWVMDISHRKYSEKYMVERLEDALESKRQTENFIDMTSHGEWYTPTMCCDPADLPASEPTNFPENIQRTTLTLPRQQEMRNPLSAILQSADFIVSLLDPRSVSEDTVLPRNVARELIDSAQTVILCAQHQKRIVDDVLTLSKLDASLLVISPDKVQPPSLVTKAVKMYEAEIARANIKTTICIESSYNELDVDWVVLDSSRLLQVIINLLTNAIKFTQHSDHRDITLCIGASREPPTGKHHHTTFIPAKHGWTTTLPSAEWGDGEELYIQFAVTDTGRGLSEDEMSVLFKRFSQASPKTYKQYGGSGLGLFISRELCELQGGQIGVSSGNGKTTFTFFVKARRVSGAAARDLKRPSIPEIADAHKKSSIRTCHAPTTNGNTSHGRTPSDNTSVPTTTSPAICHPDSPSLISHPWEDRTRARTPSNASLPSTLQPQRPLHVLIVEDNIINQKVLSQQLSRAGCVVHVADHGLECLAFLSKTTFASPTSDSLPTTTASTNKLSSTPPAPPTSTGQQIPLSVILLDLEMPTMDGLTCIRHIRAQQASGRLQGHVPVIAVTANARSDQVAVALDAGMDDVVTKPFRVGELMPRLFGVVEALGEQ